MNSTSRLVILVAIVVAGLILVGCGQAPNSGGTGSAASNATGASANGAATSGAGVTLTLVGPCGMTIPIEEAISAFKVKHPDINFKTSYDNSVIIARKVVEKGEPCDIFISPGSRQLEIVKKSGKVDESSVTPFTSFELVVIVPKANPAHIFKPQDLLKARQVSMPTPDLDSTGYAGRQALQKLGLWEPLQGKLATTWHAIESHNWVAAGKSQAGIAFRNCPLETNPAKLSLSKVSVAFAFPPDSYDLPLGLAAMLTSCQHPTEAKEFIAFLASPEGQKIIAKFGLPSLKPATAASGGSAGSPGSATNG